MGHVSVMPLKRQARQWKLLDLVSGLMFLAVVMFLMFVFTPLGNSLAASGRQALVGSMSDPKQRDRMIKMVEAGQPLEACPLDSADHIPCEDPRRSSQFSRERNFYRERHCPPPDQKLLCLIPRPTFYKIPVPWPQSLYKIWHGNVPHNKIADRKGHQGWMKEEGPYFIFPGGGTMFPDGAVQYIQKLKQYMPIGDGRIRTALDVGCGVASFGGYLLNENVLTMSFAPRDSHKSQIQFALERGIPAFIAMLGTRRLSFPARSFDLAHCSRCLIPFTAYNGSYFIEMDRLLRPGGYFVISGPPVLWLKQEKEWADLQDFARMLCYELVTVDGNTAIWKKPSNDSCSALLRGPAPDLCDEHDDLDVAWYVPLRDCIGRLPSVKGGIAVDAIPKWPERLNEPPPRGSRTKNFEDIFKADTRRWGRRVSYYKKTLNLKLGSSTVRNIMDMNAGFGGFAAAIISDPVWVMNVVPAYRSNTLGVIYDRGLIGVYHDWCEAFSTYPRTYDFIHVVGIGSLIRDVSRGGNRCSFVDVMIEMDRILRPEGTVVVRDIPMVIEKVAKIASAIHWSTEIHNTEPESNGKEKLLVASKQFWPLQSSSS
uniref:Methyltransferase n=1 Tax=Wollemia nobilis TaxID=56998 RepID=A0A0C9RLG6_9CONI